MARARSRTRTPIWSTAEILIKRSAELLAVETERLQDRPVADREQDRILGAGIGVVVLRPRGQRDDVVLLPVERGAVDHAAALALLDEEHRAAGDALGLQLLALADHLYPAGHGGQHRAAGLRVRVLEHDAVMRAAVVAAQVVQRLH